MTAMWPRSESSEKAFAILRMMIPVPARRDIGTDGAVPGQVMTPLRCRSLPGPVPRSGMTPRRRRTRWPPLVGYVA
jgi:hypothetical protein